MFGSLFYIGAAVLSTAVDNITNTILAQIGSIGDEYVYSDKAEWYQHVGFSSRPSKPKKGHQAAECVAIRDDRDVVIASRDIRSQQIYGNLKDGETCLWAGGDDGTGQGRVILKADGSINIFATSDNTDAGNSVYFRVAPDGFAWVAPWGTIKFDPSGFHVRHASGARIDLGAMGGLPSPLDVLTSYATMTAASVGLVGTIAGGGSSGDTAAKSSALISFATALGAVGTALAANTPTAGAGSALEIAAAQLAASVPSSFAVD